MLIEETPIPDAALPVAAFKAHLRLGSGFVPESVQDAVLSSFLRAAIVAVEGRTGKVLIKRSFSTQVTAWRDPACHVLPVAPVSTVTLLEQVARDGSRVTPSPDDWWLERDIHSPKVRATRGLLPEIPVNGSVVISFDAGYSLTWEEVPADLQQAVLMLGAHYYEYRHDTGLSEGCMPFGVSSLIERYKVIRLGNGVAK